MINPHPLKSTWTFTSIINKPPFSNRDRDFELKCGIQKIKIGWRNLRNGSISEGQSNGNAGFQSKAVALQAKPPNPWIRQMPTCHTITYFIFSATHQDAVMAVLPFFHIYGASAIMFHKMSVGAKIVTMAKFHPEKYLEALKKFKIDVLYVAPPMRKS